MRLSAASCACSVLGIVWWLLMQAHQNENLMSSCTLTLDESTERIVKQWLLTMQAASSKGYEQLLHTMATYFMSRTSSILALKHRCS